MKRLLITLLILIIAGCQPAFAADSICDMLVLHKGKVISRVPMTPGWQVILKGAECAGIVDPPEPEPPPVDPEAGIVQLVSGKAAWFSLGAHKSVMLKFNGYSSCKHPLQIHNTPSSQQPPTVHMLVKRGSKPTMADYLKTKLVGSRQYDCTDGRYYPAKPVVIKDLFYNYNHGSHAEFVEILESFSLTPWYVLLYNDGAEKVSGQRVIATFDY